MGLLRSVEIGRVYSGIALFLCVEVCVKDVSAGWSYAPAGRVVTRIREWSTLNSKGFTVVGEVVEDHRPSEVH